LLEIERSLVKTVLPVLCISALAVGATIAYGEIQVLFRGQCLTDEEAEKKLQQFASQYQTAPEWQTRAARIRTGILRGAKLEHMPPKCALNTIRHSLRQENGYTVENVAFESLPHFWVTGNLYLPAKPAGIMAAVLCPHGHLADNRMLEPTQKRCAALARMGAAVFAYDMVGYGESTPVPHHHGETLRLQTYNSMRVVDFLLSLGSVDEKRLGVTGESGGGTQTFLLAAVDDRIAVSVPVVMVSAGFYGGCSCESGMPIHKSADHETDNVEIAASFAPKPQLIISDGADWTKNVPRVEFPYMQRVYALVGAPDQIENAHFATEQHDYGPSKRAAMYPFMAKHLGLDLSQICDASGKIDESFVTVHERKDLLVFPEDRPRPDGAITDAEKVFAELDRK
jgi:pimeloyl-ACP methyl ester carboxylesterase